MVRQSRDFSCGLAALATVLSDFGKPVSEAQLLDELLGAPHRGAEGRQTPAVSFSDLARLAENRGFAAVGVEVPSGLLKHLRRPAIVALAIDGRAHFSVLRAVAEDGSVLLADPSWGRRRLHAWQFARYFLPAVPGPESPAARGRLLLVMPRTGPEAPRSPPAGEPGAGGTSPSRSEDASAATEAHGDRATAAVPDWRWPVHLPPAVVLPRAQRAGG